MRVLWSSESVRGTEDMDPRRLAGWLTDGVCEE